MGFLFKTCFENTLDYFLGSHNLPRSRSACLFKSFHQWSLSRAFFNVGNSNSLEKKEKRLKMKQRSQTVDKSEIYYCFSIVSQPAITLETTIETL